MVAFVSLRQHGYPGIEQVGVLEMHCSHARYIYNHGLEHLKMRYSGSHANTTAALQVRELTEDRCEFAWLAAGSTVVQQGALRDLDRAFSNFFTGRARFPKFRSAKDLRAGFVIRDVKLQQTSKRWARIQVPKAGWLKFRLTYPWDRVKVATSARVTVEGDRWHVALTTPPRGKVNTHATANPIGIDRGVTNTLVTSDSEFFQIPSLTADEQQRFLALQRQLSCHRKSSRRREVTRSKLRELYRRLADRRRDWIEQTTTELALRHRSIAVERLPVTNMVRRPKPKPDPDNAETVSDGAA